MLKGEIYKGHKFRYRQFYATLQSSTLLNVACAIDILFREISIMLG